MKRVSMFANRRGGLDVKMTPMIDVVFLLLVFFVWTASFQIVEQILPSNLAQSSGSQESPIDTPPPPEADFDDVVVRILWTVNGPQWQINDQPLASLAAVRDRLERIATIKRDAPVILLPDPDTPLGDVIDVFDLARLQDFEKVSFAARDAG
ncbi:MAG: biopolymer transporter ExbD [Pirellulaceae bacterium]|jgi:biopolymer transport protein ExbD|nr:biopolymer transporter ExbD [Pirellulaceae bacterium]MDP7015109.1 biopolymer transporter ExbD [Pirellulaceae bacterium]